MSGWREWAVTLAVFLPALGALVIAVLPSRDDLAPRKLAIVFSGAALLVGIAMLFGFDYGGAGLQFQMNAGWISALHIRYHVGVDGIDLPLLELTLLLSFLCAVYTYRILPSPGRPKAFLALMLLLETGMAGTFVAFDLVLFFVFWELVLVPMYFMIGIWGSANRQYAAIKFFLYTLLGSVFMLLGFIAMYFKSSPHTFDIIALQHQAATSPFARNVQLLIFAAVFLGFAVKVPVWPFHTWLPDAHTEAPTVGSVLLAGILLKMGAYGFIRIALPILPEAAKVWAPILAILGTIAIVYAALACLAQTDLKRLIAFSSVGHMGFVMLAISTLSSVGINAAIFGMVAHGVITGMLFFEIGSIYDRYHTRQISELGGGMFLKAPRLGFVFAFTAIASMGLPGLAGFWGEVLSLFSAYSPVSAHVELFRTLMVFGGIGTVLTAGYILWTIQRVGMGTVPEARLGESVADVTTIEWLAWVPMLVGIVLLGLVPRLLTGMTNEAVTALTRIFVR
jgi:NADH-quinone oxidoreductase subunit M